MNLQEEKPIHNLTYFLHKLDQEHNSQDQGIEDYKLGGYHPTHIGQELINRYVIIQKLGWGHFSTVWLAKDFKHNNYVAIKIMKSSTHYMQAAYDQVEILQKVAKMVHAPQWINSIKEYKKGQKTFSRDDTHVVQLLNSFLFKGPYGNHFCMVFQILGVNLLEVLKRYDYKGVPMNICRQISKQILIGLDFLHRICKVIHTDLKPQNVLLCLTEQQIKEIIENGQLNKNQLFSERIKIYQQFFGIVANQVQKSPPDLDKNKIHKKYKLPDDQLQKVLSFEQKLKDKTLTSTQRKNIKNKLKKIFKRNDIIIQSHKQHSQISENKHPKTIEELFSQTDGKLIFDRGPKLVKGKFSVKIADLGNACWTHHHFASEIQTRQYRGPEVLLGSKYDTSADMWSMACMIFQMLTGDLLFNPRRDNDNFFGKNDDHIAQMMQLLGRFPKKFTQRGKKAKVMVYEQKFIDKNGMLKRIQKIEQWPLQDVLIGRYKIKATSAKNFAKFLQRMLECVPEKRATAQQMLQDSWINDDDDQIYMQKILKRTQSQYEIQYRKFQNNENVGKMIPQYQTENEDASVQNNNEDHESSDDQFFQYKRKGDIRLIDRSFTDLGYIGYGEGIRIDQLDTIANWQFD